MDPLQQDCREAFLNEKLAFSWKAGQTWAQLDLAGIHITQDTCSQHHVSIMHAMSQDWAMFDGARGLQTYIQAVYGSSLTAHLFIKL